MFSDKSTQLNSLTTSDLQPYDALLLVSFGGPNQSDDVLPFLKNVTRGKGIPDARLEQVGHHYTLFGGKSPINEQNLQLIDALKAQLAQRGSNLPVLWGNRNWHPYTIDTLRDAQSFGVRRMLAIVTSAYASYSGSRQYREHLAQALAELGSDIQIDILRPFFNSPGFIEGNYAAITAAAAKLDGGLDGAHIVYVTHSIPITMQDASAATGPGYLQQHQDVLATINALILERTGIKPESSLAFCSRSGAPHTPWLEPDINDHLTELASQGVTKVVIAPIGFVSDHMEVAFDLDTEALETAEQLGLSAQRAATVGTSDIFVSGLIDLVAERAARERGETTDSLVAGGLDAFPDQMPPNSCRMRHGEVTGIPVIAGTRD